jgi:hypothetical protein
MKLIQLGNGRVKMRAVRLASNRWGVVFGAPDGKGEAGEGWDPKAIYTPAEDDVIVEITNSYSGDTFQHVLNCAVQGTWNAIHARPA